jgi:hypothetical protein
MALTTFGAIMGFAAKLAKEKEELYKSLSQKTKDTALMEILEVLSGEEGKNYALMMRARRENVTEMILEPVTGLYEQDYDVDLKGTEPTEDGGILKTALMLEKLGKKFFQDASSQVPLPEVARIFRRVAQKKEDNLAKLQDLC